MGECCLCGKKGGACGRQAALTDAPLKAAGELDRRLSELRQVEQRGALRGNLPARRGSGPRSSREGKAFPTKAYF